MIAVAVRGDDIVDTDIRKLLGDGGTGIAGVDDHTGAFADIRVAVGLYRAHHKAADLVLLGSHRGSYPRRLSCWAPSPGMRRLAS